MDGLVESVRAVAHAGGRDHADRARDLARLVGEDVAKEIFGHDDVELARVTHELHRRVVDIHVAKLDIGVVLRDLCDRLAPETRGVEHVGLVDGGDALAALARGLERDARDTLDLVLGVGHDVCGFLLAVRLFRAVLAEVHAADELAHDDEVDAAFRDVGAQRAGGGELGEHLRRAHVRVEAHALAQLEQTALGTVGGGLIVPLRAADRTEQHAVRVAAGR